MSDTVQPLHPQTPAIARLLHRLVQLLQRLPSTGDTGGQAVLFDGLRAALLEAGVDIESPGADGQSLMQALQPLQRRPLGHDPLVFELQQVLRRHGWLQGQRAARLQLALERLLDGYLRSFWQEETQTLDAVNAGAQPAPFSAPDLNHLNLPWHLRPAARHAQADDDGSAPTAPAPLEDVPHGQFPPPRHGRPHLQ